MTMTNFGFAVPQIFSSTDIDLDLTTQVARRAETIGFHDLWTLDVLFGRATGLEATTLLAYLAAVTDRIRLGVSVLVLPERNPVQLAKALASIDHLSRGRLTIGLGLGEHHRDAVFGLPPGRRVTRFRESLQLMQSLWTEETATFKGDLYQLPPLSMTPRPLQQPHPPIWFGGRSDGALQRAVEYGVAWMGAGSSTPDEFAKLATKLRATIEQAGRDQATFTISKRVYIVIDDDPARAQRTAAQWFGRIYGNPDRGPDCAITGTLDTCREQIAALVDSGAGHLLLNPLEDPATHLEALADYASPPSGA